MSVSDVTARIAQIQAQLSMLAHASDMPLTRQQSTSAKMHDRPLNETTANLTP